jgi:hypothetical protein
MGALSEEERRILEGLKTELVAKHYPGRQVVPVLAGALIGGEVEDYARRKGVLVYTY